MMSWKDWLVCIVLLVATSWALASGKLFHVHDFTHGARIAEMADAISDGHIPVRWSAHFGYGYGMPLFHFYAPLPYAVGAGLHLSGLPLSLSVSVLFLLANALTVVAALLVSKQWFSGWIAWIAASAIVLAPYRALNLFVRGAISESWGLAFFIFSIWGIGEVVKGKSRAWLWLTLSLTGLLLSHNLTALMAAPFLALWAILVLIVLRGSYQLLPAIGKLAGAAFLSLSISMFYVLPALTEKQFTQLSDRILTGYFAYHQHFLYIRQFFQDNWGYGGSAWGPEDDISFFLGYGQWSLLILAGLTIMLLIGLMIKNRTTAISASSTSTSRSVQISLGALALGGLALFLSLSRSESLWQAVPVLAYIQFPWRFISITSVFLSLGIGCIKYIKNYRVQYAVLAVTTLLLSLNVRYFQPEKYLDNSDALYYSDPDKIASDMSSILPDYLPKDLTVDSPPTALFTCEPIACEGVSVQVDRTHEKLVFITVPEPTTLTWSVANFPGWVVEVDGVVAEHTTSDTGLISVTIPAETNQVGLLLKKTTIQMIADTTSAMGILVLFGLMLPASGTIGVTPNINSKSKKKSKAAKK